MKVTYVQEFSGQLSNRFSVGIGLELCISSCMFVLPLQTVLLVPDRKQWDLETRVNTHTRIYMRVHEGNAKDQLVCVCIQVNPSNNICSVTHE